MGEGETNIWHVKRPLIIIGVNKFQKENESVDIPILEIREEVQKEQIDRLNMIKKERDDAKIEILLNNITKAASNGDSVMEPIIEAALEYATLGEIVDSMKEVFGEWTENISI